MTVERSTFPGEDRAAEIPNATLQFVQDGNTPQSVLTFVVHWPKPMGANLPPGSQPAGVFVFLEIDRQRVDPVSTRRSGLQWWSVAPRRDRFRYPEVYGAS